MASPGPAPVIAGLADIGAKIKFINDSFVLDGAQTELTGKNADTIITNAVNNTKFLNNLFNFTTFKTSILPPVSFVSTIAMLQKIYVKDGNTNFAAATTLTVIPPATATAAVPASAAGVTPVIAAVVAVPAITDAQRDTWRITAANILNSEYNYHLLLIDDGATFGALATPASGSRPLEAFGPSFAGTAKSLLEILNNIRIAYNILEPNAFIDYKRSKQESKTTLTTPIGQYKLVLDATTGVPTGKSATIDNVSNIRAKVLNIIDLDKIDEKNTRLQMVRRLLYLYELIIHIYLAAYLVERTASNASVRLGFYDILYDTVKMLYARNDVVDDAGSDLNLIIKDLQVKMRAYGENSNSIEAENIKLKKVKMDISIEKDRLNTSESYENKVSKVFYIYLIVLLLVIGGIVMIMLNDTLSDGMKKLFIGILAGVSILVMVALYLLNRYVIMEPFAGLVTLPASLEAAGVEAGYVSFIADQTGSAMRGAVYTYLTNTINVGLITDSYKDYADMNYSISKEVNYYTNKNETLKKDKNTITNAHRIMELEAFINRYRIQYFVQLLVTITVTALLVTYLPIPGLTTFLIIIAALLILLFTYMYIINVNNLVHTDARKLYWGQPSEIKNLQY